MPKKETTSLKKPAPQRAAQSLSQSEESAVRRALVIEAVLDKLRNGGSLQKACKAVEGAPTAATFLEWVHKDPELSKQYAHARELGYTHLADEIVDIADTTQTGETRTTKDDGGVEISEGDMIQHRRLRVDTRKWLLSKVLPKIYGDKITQEVTGADGGPITLAVSLMSPEQLMEHANKKLGVK